MIDAAYGSGPRIFGRAGDPVRSYSWPDLVADVEEKPAVDDWIVALVGAFNRAQQLIAELKSACGARSVLTSNPGMSPTPGKSAGFRQDLDARGSRDRADHGSAKYAATVSDNKVGPATAS